MRNTFIVILMVGMLSCLQGAAQQVLKGRVYFSNSDSTMGGINVVNKTRNIQARSGEDGNYSVRAEENDIIVFSASGFKSDTVKVRFDQLLTQYDPGLYPLVISLSEVKVTGGYSADSLSRRNYYSHIYDQRLGVVGPNRPDDGVGFTMSPISSLSAQSKQTKKLRKRLEREEEEDYIDHSFPQTWVQTITGLEGDSLSLFMYQYRPGYDFCRKTDRQGMTIYVNDSLKEFMKPKKKK